MTPRKNNPESRKKSNPQKPPKRPTGPFFRYTTLAFEMAASIGGGAALGYWLDLKTENAYHLYVIIFSLLGIALAYYRVFKDISKNDQ